MHVFTALRDQGVYEPLLATAFDIDIAPGGDRRHGFVEVARHINESVQIGSNDGMNCINALAPFPPFPSTTTSTTALGAGEGDPHIHTLDGRHYLLLSQGALTLRVRVPIIQCGSIGKPGKCKKRIGWPEERCMVVKLYPSINLIDRSCRQARMHFFFPKWLTLPESHSGSFSFWRYSGVDAELQSKKAAGQPCCIPLHVSILVPAL